MLVAIYHHKRALHVSSKAHLKDCVDCANHLKRCNHIVISCIGPIFAYAESHSSLQEKFQQAPDRHGCTITTTVLARRRKHCDVVVRILQVSNVVGLHVCAAPSALQISNLTIRARYSKYRTSHHISVHNTRTSRVDAPHTCMAPKMEEVHCYAMLRPLLCSNNGGASSSSKTSARCEQARAR